MLNEFWQGGGGMTSRPGSRECQIVWGSARAIIACCAKGRCASRCLSCWHGACAGHCLSCWHMHTVPKDFTSGVRTVHIHCLPCCCCWWCLPPFVANGPGPKPLDGRRTEDCQAPTWEEQQWHQQVLMVVLWPCDCPVPQSCQSC